MAEAMRQNVAQFLNGIERYNPVNLPTLERYVEVQSQENAYDLEANIAVLKLYQFNQQYNIDITSQILLKALTNLPHTDFALCKCLLSEQMCKEAPISQIVYLADLLESCNFQQFWASIYSMPDLYAKIQGFQDSIRKFVCHVVGITFQSINKHSLCELLGNIDEGSMKKWVKKYGWKEIENGLIFISNQDENIKTKNISEEISFEKLVDILNIH
ncbi:eukaryotic translation initiation factor 3 subunit K [Planococcus citri]|uniref:eukaryotic translation initiation factor 3 subunit K n=1 Tax=Planococcus citri TaxID=170843 RepID=UPI0031F7411D